MKISKFNINYLDSDSKVTEIVSHDSSSVLDHHVSISKNSAITISFSSGCQSIHSDKFFKKLLDFKKLLVEKQYCGDQSPRILVDIEIMFNFADEDLTISKNLTYNDILNVSSCTINSIEHIEFDISSLLHCISSSNSSIIQNFDITGNVKSQM